MNSEASIVDRLYDALVEEVTETRPELLSESFTVAEIYQNLVPYRTHRERVGAEMNGDYEHALLRLLAGEGGYVTLESDVARNRLEEELNSIHPDTGVYRNFAACEVRLRHDRLEDRGIALDLEGPVAGSQEDGGTMDTDESEDGIGQEPVSDADGDVEEDAAEVAAEVDGDARAEGDAEGDASTEPFAAAARTSNGADRPDDEADQGTGDESASGLTEEELDAELRAAMEGTGETAEDESEPDAPAAEGPGGDSSDDGPPDTCLWCRESLPERDDLRFCPYCGSSVDVRPCPDCGAEVESDWIFCIACGAEAVA